MISRATSGSSASVEIAVTPKTKPRSNTFLMLGDMAM
jgi:hypothetical protein